jgi:hypothetical protein
MENISESSCMKGEPNGHGTGMKSTGIRFQAHMSG